MRNYTLELRPNTRVVEVSSVVYTQNSTEWFKANTNNITPVASVSSDRGVCVRTPLENVSITVKELCALLQGLESAYEQLVDIFDQELPSILVQTQFGSKEMFMECLPSETASIISCHRSWDLTRREISDTCIYLTGDPRGPLLWAEGSWRYCTHVPEAAVWVGNVFGLEIVYSPAFEDEVLSLTGEDLVEMVVSLLNYKMDISDDRKKLLAVFGFIEGV